MKSPGFWWRGIGIRALLLAPLGAVYGQITSRRMRRGGGRMGPVPVVCVGNFVAGGAGKTPLAIALARVLAESGRRPVFLTRGYGGRLPGPLVVDPAVHSASMVGDEALLLAAVAPTIVSRRRAAGLGLVAALDADVCIMDDGLQNPSIAKDLALAVVDAAVGVGNGFCLPAGPLRAPLSRQIPFVDAVVMMGEGGGGGQVVRHLARAGRPVLRARLVQRGVAPLVGERAYVFAGIGRPEKVFDQLQAAGVDVVGTRSFADHHAYTSLDCGEILTRAEALGAVPVTTEKDWVRLLADGTRAGAELRERTAVVGVDAVFEAPDGVVSLVEDARWRRLAGREPGGRQGPSYRR